MAKKTKKAKNASVWEATCTSFSFRPWALFEQISGLEYVARPLLCESLERNHCAGIAKPSSEAVSVYRFEFAFFSLLLSAVLQPGMLSTWVSIPVMFLWLMSRGIRRAIKDTFCGIRIAFDTGGKVFGFLTFSIAINCVFACLIATVIEWSERLWRRVLISRIDTHLKNSLQPSK